MEERLAQEAKWVKKLTQRKGRAELLKHLQGKRLTARQAINAACFRCSSGYDTGLGCTTCDCPLVYLNPYNVAKENGGKVDLEELSDSE